MKIQIQQLAIFLRDKGSVVTLHQQPDCSGNYRFRVWSGPLVGSVRNNLFDTDGAEDLLLLEITSRYRESLEFGALTKDFLKGKSKSVTEDGFGIVAVWM